MEVVEMSFVSVIAEVDIHRLYLGFRFPYEVMLDVEYERYAAVVFLGEVAIGIVRESDFFYLVPCHFG